MGETVLVGIQNGIYCQYVLAQLPESPDRLEVQSGLLRPITRTAIGRVLLSLRPNNEIEAIVRRCNAEVPEEWMRVRPAEFLEVIEDIRRKGYARTAGEMMASKAVLAVSMPAPTGKMPMAVGVGGNLDRIAQKEEEILAALVEFKANLASSV